MRYTDMNNEDLRDLLTVDRNGNGSYTVRALVAGSLASQQWFKSHTYYGYTPAEACEMYLNEFKFIMVKG